MGKIIDTLKQLLAHQYEASLSALNLCVARCPDAIWNEPVAKWKFCQAALHAVFFTDLYLQGGDDVEAFKGQPFHLEHKAVFRDYEELEDRPQVLLYERPFVLGYLQHVRRKAQETIAREPADVLAGPSGFHWRKCSRAELRKQARTLVGPLVPQSHYEIPFTKREEFESAWPHLLKVKSKGAPIILVRGQIGHGITCIPSWAKVTGPW